MASNPSPSIEDLNSVENAAHAPRPSSGLDRSRAIARQLAADEAAIDRGIPPWAQRRNPIVRRELGVYWRVYLPQFRPIWRWALLQIVIVLLSIHFQALLAPIMILALSAVIILPFGVYWYAQAMYAIITEATRSMSKEYTGDTLTVLRVTPFSSLQIVLSKVAAAVWRRMDETDAVLSVVLFASMPVMAFMQIIKWSPELYPGVAQGLVVAGLVVSLLRIPLELFMVSSIGVMMGATVRWRSPATTAALVLVGFYFLLLNLPRLIDLSLPWQILVEMVLPLVLPVVISAGSVFLTIMSIERD